MGARSVVAGITGLALIGSFPARVVAQRPELPVSVGQAVRITLTDGRVTNGRVASLTPPTIEVSGGADDPTTVKMDDVRRIQLRDPLRNGTVTGAVSVGLVGLLVGAAFQEIHNDYGDGPDGRKALVASVAVGTVLGALVGAGIDAARSRTIFERPRAGVSLSVQPIVTATVQGVGVRLRW